MCITLVSTFTCGCRHHTEHIPCESRENSNRGYSSRCPDHYSNSRLLLGDCQRHGGMINTQNNWWTKQRPDDEDDLDSHGALAIELRVAQDW